MSALRLASSESVPALLPCCRCRQTDQRWDRIAGKAYCANCQEMLVLGEAEPLVERTLSTPCSLCNHRGAVCYHTFPLRTEVPVEMFLCPEHLRGLLSRRLGQHAFHQLRRQLSTLGISRADIFLLHEAFYDLEGRAIQPVFEVG